MKNGKKKNEALGTEPDDVNGVAVVVVDVVVVAGVTVWHLSPW